MRHRFDRWQVSLMLVIMVMLAVVLALSLGGAVYGWTPGPGQNVVVENGQSFSGKTTTGTERPMLTFTNANAVRLNAPPAGAIFFTVANTEMMRIANNGNVGIGDKTPTEAKLVVSTTSGEGVFVDATGSDLASIHGTSDTCTGVLGRSLKWGFPGVQGENNVAGGWGVFGVSANGVGVRGYSTNGLAGEFEGNVEIKGTLKVGEAPGVSMGRIYLTTSGTILSTDNDSRRLVWYDDNDEIQLTNVSGDWLDYWWQTQKGAATAGDSGSIPNNTTEYAIISGIDQNDYGIEVHFGQADGTAGWCSVWLQHVAGKLVGHYIKY